MMSSPPEPVQYAQTCDGIVVVRVLGKGTHLQSPNLRYIFEITKGNDPPPRYILDLAGCTTMDSTFMGTIASIALHQRKAIGIAVVVVNSSDHVRKLMETLGLKFIVDLRRGTGGLPGELNKSEFQPAAAPAIDPVERMIMMIEAHEKLVDCDSDNEIKFEGVLKSLRESLDRARQSNSGRDG
jgi:anti-anti-sigma factor